MNIQRSGPPAAGRPVARTGLVLFSRYCRYILFDLWTTYTVICVMNIFLNAASMYQV